MENLAKSRISLLEAQKREKMKPDVAFFLRKRYYVIICIMISRVIMILLKTNLSICLVDMTSNKTVKLNNSTYIKEPDFHWTSIQKGIILSLFSWGYFCSLIGGVLTMRFGGVKIFGIGIMLTGILTVMSPIFIKLHFFVYVTVRFFEGLFAGFSYAAQGVVLYQWCPPHERTILTTIAFAGVPLGHIVSYPVSGYLTHIFNWEATFQITGGFSVLWSLTWLAIFTDSPSNDKFITAVEKNYFEGLDLIKPKKKAEIPWKKMLTSMPLWALINEKFIASWSGSFLAVCLPLYIKDIHDTNIKEIGWFSSVPHYFNFFGRAPVAVLADYLRRTNSKTKIHRMYILCAQIGAACFIFTAGITNHFLISLILFCGFKLFYAVAYVSYCVMPLDIGAQYSSLIWGFCSMASSSGEALNPLVIGFMVQNHTFAEWSRYFFVLGALNVWALGFFAFYGSGELQPWAISEDEKTRDT